MVSLGGGYPLLVRQVFEKKKKKFYLSVNYFFGSYRAFLDQLSGKKNLHLLTLGSWSI